MKLKKKIFKKIYRWGALKKKVLLLLFGGLALYLSQGRGAWKIIKGIHKEWKKINRQHLRRIIKEFYHQRLIAFKEKSHGKIEVILTDKGKLKALECKLEEMEIEIPSRWDKKWRIVIFDIPEKKRYQREIFRDKLKKLGFLKIQKSVFIFPYPCEDEINFLVEVLKIRRYVRIVLAKNITNQEELLLKFNLI